MSRQMLIGVLAEVAARTAHEVNRAYCLGLGDYSQLSWDAVPDWQKDSVRRGVQFIIDNPDTVPSVQHDAWLEVKRAEGWKYGPVKDAGVKEHPCFLPYDELPEAQKMKDVIFGAVVRGILGCL